MDDFFPIVICDSISKLDDSLYFLFFPLFLTPSSPKLFHLSISSFSLFSNLLCEEWDFLILSLLSFFLQQVWYLQCWGLRTSSDSQQQLPLLSQSYKYTYNSFPQRLALQPLQAKHSISHHLILWWTCPQLVAFDSSVWHQLGCILPQ